MKENGRGINILPLLQAKAIKNRSGLRITEIADLWHKAGVPYLTKMDIPPIDINHLLEGGSLVIDVGGNVFRQKPINGNGNK